VSHGRLQGAHGFRGWLAVWLLLPLVPMAAFGGGPKYVAGVTFFNPGVVGQPVHWANGQLNYYVDQGPLNGSVGNQQAVAMVLLGPRALIVFSALEPMRYLHLVYVFMALVGGAYLLSLIHI